MKKILTIILAGSFSFAIADVMPYATYINYSLNAAKNKGYIVGLYGSYKNKSYKLELDIENTLIEYKNNIENWNQNDLTIVSSFYTTNNLIYKIGIHNIWNKQESNNSDKIFIGGIEYYKGLRYNIGVNGYYSKYNNFNVYQISPYIGYSFGNYNSDIGSFYVNIQINKIYLNKANVANKQNYTDLNLQISNYQGPYVTTLKASLGTSAYKILNNGFVVYNLGDEKKYSYGGNLNYSITSNYFINVGYTFSKFTEKETNINYSSNTFALSYLFKF